MPRCQGAAGTRAFPWQRKMAFGHSPPRNRTIAYAGLQPVSRQVPAAQRNG